MREFRLMFSYAGSLHQYDFKEGLGHEFGKDAYLDNRVISVYLDTYFETYPDKLKEGEEPSQIVLYENKNGQHEKVYEQTKCYWLDD